MKYAGAGKRHENVEKLTMSKMFRQFRISTHLVSPCQSCSSAPTVFASAGTETELIQ